MKSQVEFYNQSGQRFEGTLEETLKRWQSDPERLSVTQRTRLWWGGLVITVWVFCDGPVSASFTTVLYAFFPSPFTLLSAETDLSENGAIWSHDRFVAKWRNPFK